MSEETIKIPKFRKVGRIVSWMQKNEYCESIPQAEELFLNSNEDAVDILYALIGYHEQIGFDLSPELQNLLYVKAQEAIVPADEHMSHVSTFLRYCHNLQVEDDRVSKYLDLFAGKSEKLVRWAIWSGERLPKHLEDTIDSPYDLLRYATDVVRGRIPEHLENVFHKDIHVATQYAFDVIRGFAPCRLPDHLHNAVIMESFKDPDNYDIKNYMKASESDPNKTGNFSNN
jgi:hypothetical protein